jgi:hypothetical protein
LYETTLLNPPDALGGNRKSSSLPFARGGLGWGKTKAKTLVNQVWGEVLRIYAINILNSGGRFLNSGDRFLNSGDRLLNSGDRLLNSGDRLLNSGDRLLNSGGRLLNSGSRFNIKSG